MSGPWEKYGASASNDGPWSKYADNVQQPAPVDEPGLVKNAMFGALKGASDIGATLLSPVAALANAIGGEGTMITGDERRASLGQFFRENANPESIAFKGGELGAQVAGTAGAGGVLAKGLGAIPGVSSAAPALLNSIGSGGFSLGKPASATMLGRAGDAALRAAGGASLGGMSAGLVNPETAGTGAVIGAVAPGAVKAAGVAGGALKRALGNAAAGATGLSTGAGKAAIDTAYSAGKQGNQAFLQNMRGAVDPSDVLSEAKGALMQMRIDRGNAYRQGMAAMSKDKTVLDMSPIQDAVKKMQSLGAYKGQTINKNAAGTVQEVSDQVSNWSSLDPNEFHTPEGLDALKQAIGDIRDASQFGTPARKAADTVYNAVKAEIQKQAPDYAKTMRGYSEASDLISEIERALSLGEKAAADTSMRKLQSLMRNNVNTNYGNRLALANELSKNAPNLLPAIAGQALNSIAPRGLQGIAATGTGIYGMANPALLAALPFQSPRLMGEAAYGSGRAMGMIPNMPGLLGNGLFPLVTAIPAITLSGNKSPDKR